MLAEIERFEPEMAAASKAAVNGYPGISISCDSPLNRSPERQESIDYAVMERTELAAVVRADLAGPTSALEFGMGADHDAAGNAWSGR